MSEKISNTMKLFSNQNVLVAWECFLLCLVNKKSLVNLKFKFCPTVNKHFLILPLFRIRIYNNNIYDNDKYLN